jgi:SNF2 family DNA or RNA helicase
MLYYLDYSDHPEQAKINKELSKYAAIVLDNDDTKAISIPYLIALITRKRQAAVWPEGIEFKNPDGEIVYKVSSMQSVKMDKCITGTADNYEGLIPEIAGSGERYPAEPGRTYGEFEGERVVVFSQFKTALAELETRLVSAGYSVLRLDGDSNDADRNAARTDFARKLRANADYQGPRYQIILANYKTGGVGLNFTDATHLIELDSEWSPGKVDQARGRIDRIGQTEETTVHRLLVSNSIETWLDNLVQTKRELVQGFEEAANLMQSMMEALRNEEI